MKLTQAAWDDYISRLSRLNQKAGQLMREYMDEHPEADTDALIRYAYAFVTKYGEGSAELACQMYDALAEAQGVTLPAAEPAPTATYGEVTGMVKATQDSPRSLQSGVSRMVKQAGADTTTRNAIRDGAEWAWVPHGDACPFCRMLASNGWQRASKNLLKKGHAQHIHANCDCEFAVRFSRERINAQKRAAYASQAYRKDRGAVSEISLIRRSEEVKLSVRQVESYKTPVYVSDQATIKPKALHRINQNTEKALSDWGVSLDRKPKIIVVGDNELRGAVGIYDPCENVVYYAESVGKKTVQDVSGGFGVIEAHEMWHMKQAEDFRQSGWVITRENRAEYLDALCKKCKGRIDKLGITRDNVRELSQYAADMYLGERFDEVEAEFMSLRRRK